MGTRALGSAAGLPRSACPRQRVRAGGAAHLLVSGLLFALILRQRTRRYTSHREIGWAVLVTLCLAGFLSLAGTAHQPVTNEPADRIPAVAAAVVGVVLALGCVLLGRRQSPGGRASSCWRSRSAPSTPPPPPC